MVILVNKLSLSQYYPSIYLTSGGIVLNPKPVQKHVKFHNQIINNYIFPCFQFITFHKSFLPGHPWNSGAWRYLIRLLAFSIIMF